MTDQQPWGEGTPRWRMLSRPGLHQALSWTKASTLTWEGSQEGLALQGMGLLFRRGSRGMRELFVAHLSEGTSSEELRIFLRTLHRSGIPARSDVVLLFPRSPVPEEFRQVIRSEDRSFRNLLVQTVGSSLDSQKSLLLQEQEGDSAGSVGNSAVDALESGEQQQSDKLSEPFPGSSATDFLTSNASFSVLNVMAYRGSAEASRGPTQPSLWGNGSSSVGLEEAPQWAAWGSIVGFEMQELDPTETLKGFMDKPVSQLRRWVCYQMILGMVKMNYKHVILAEVSGVTFLGDALAIQRKRDGLCLATEDRTWNEAPAVQEETLQQARERLVRLGDQEGQGHAVETEEKFVDQSVVRRLKASGESREEGAERSILQARRRRRGTRRRRKKQPGTPGLIEELYGKLLWGSLEKEEKEKPVISSAIVMGGIRPIRSLANSMATEIVRVSLQRKNRHSFHDKALINYLVHKSSVLGGKVLDHIKLAKNTEPLFHVLQGSQQRDPFTTAHGAPYMAVIGYCHEKQRSPILELVHQDICASPADAAAYSDCRPTS